MLIVVVVLNTLISLVCLYVAWRVWKLQKVLAKIADTLSSVERSTHKTLYGAPNNISKGQLAIAGLRERNQKLEVQLQRVQQVLGLITLGRQTWLRRNRKLVKTPLKGVRTQQRQRQLLR